MSSSNTVLKKKIKKMCTYNFNKIIDEQGSREEKNIKPYNWVSGDKKGLTAFSPFKPLRQENHKVMYNHHAKLLKLYCLACRATTI
jgi:hypothetical protein